MFYDFRTVTLGILMTSLGLAGCGSRFAGFEIGDAEENAKRKAEEVVVTAPAEPLKVVPLGEKPVDHIVGATEAAGVIATFTYDADADHRLSLTMQNLLHEGCAPFEPEFIWRQLDGAGTTVAEAKVPLIDLFDVKAGGHFNLIVRLKAKRSTCKHMGLTFVVRRYSS